MQYKSPPPPHPQSIHVSCDQQGSAANGPGDVQICVAAERSAGRCVLCAGGCGGKWDRNSVLQSQVISFTGLLQADEFLFIHLR
jgi:hypothetical protein